MSTGAIHCAPTFVLASRANIVRAPDHTNELSLLDRFVYTHIHYCTIGRD